MATLAFSRLSNGFSLQRGSGVIKTYISNRFTVTPDPNDTTQVLVEAPNEFSAPATIIINTSDTITVDGASVTGTQAQIAAALVSQLFTYPGNNTVKAETATPLAGNGVFSVVKDFGALLDQVPVTLTVTAFADQASAASGFILQMSTDNTNFRTVASSALVINTANQLQIRIQTRYVKIQVTNGATPQTVFNINSSVSKV